MINLAVSRIFLVGFMATGKTTVGRQLARQLGWLFLDLDREIEADSGLAIPEIFSSRGETVFRDLENEALRQTKDHVGVVVSTGGGAFTFDRNRDLIASSGTSVWLDLPLARVLERLHRSPQARPLFQSDEQVVSLYENRLPSYQLADHRVVVSLSDSPRWVARRIVRLLAQET